jgi:hypothetical protein
LREEKGLREKETSNVKNLPPVLLPNPMVRVLPSPRLLLIKICKHFHIFSEKYMFIIEGITLYFFWKNVKYSLFAIQTIIYYIFVKEPFKGGMEICPGNAKDISQNH